MYFCIYIFNRFSMIIIFRFTLVSAFLKYMRKSTIVALLNFKDPMERKQIVSSQPKLW